MSFRPLATLRTLVFVFALAFSPAVYARPTDILINTAEYEGFHHTGGLGVMIRAFAAALADEWKAPVSVAMPFYMTYYEKPGFVESFRDERREIEAGFDYHANPSGEMVPARFEKFHVYSKMDGKVKVLIYRHMNRDGEPNLFDNKVPEGERKKYSPSEMEAFPAFDKAVSIDILKNQPKVKFVIENDWHAGISTYFLKHPEFFGFASDRAPKILSLIHNFGYQGEVYDLSALDRIGLDSRDYHSEGLAHSSERLNKTEHLNLQKLNLNYPDMVATVALKHAEEASTLQFGAGLEGVNVRNTLQYRFTGVLNGIDTEKWNPKNAEKFAVDLIKHYGSRENVKFNLGDAKKFAYTKENLSGKRRGKKLLQQIFGLKEDPSAFVIALTARLDKQKGFDFVPEALRNVMRKQPKIQVLIIGDGDAKYREILKDFASEFPGRAGLEPFTSQKEHGLLTFSDAHGAFSAYEPSGQTQTAAMAEGTVPITTEVGGLSEAVTDVDGTRTGFKVPVRLLDDGVTINNEATAAEVEKGILRAYDTFANSKKEWNAISLRAAAEDFSWKTQIKEYISLIQFTLNDGPARLLKAMGPPPIGKVYKPSELQEFLSHSAGSPRKRPCPRLLLPE